MSHCSMAVLFRRLAILLGLCLPLAAVSDDYDDGIAAYRKGDYKTALVKLTNLARSGDSFAQNLVGQMHDNGQGTVQNYREAVRESCDQIKFKIRAFDE
jgi:hypothetical protein